MTYQYHPGGAEWAPGYVYVDPSTKQTLRPGPAPAAAPASAPQPSRECPCGICRADCEYHRPCP